ncbi:hypothetical protein [Kitasatospora sp. NPDC007106]|uniref:hypothetical protein n=1 Tax=Kitasatospora sp. NPDC007106 TaxID=3156914 RepID=UPI0033F4ABAA
MHLDERFGAGEDSGWKVVAVFLNQVATWAAGLTFWLRLRRPGARGSRPFAVLAEM